VSESAPDTVHIVCICAKSTFSILRASVVWGADSAEQAASQVPYATKEEQWVYKVLVGPPLISPDWAKRKTIPTPDTESDQLQREFMAAYDAWSATPSGTTFCAMVIAREAVAALHRRPGIPGVI